MFLYLWQNNEQCIPLISYFVKPIYNPKHNFHLKLQEIKRRPNQAIRWTYTAASLTSEHSGFRYSPHHYILANCCSCGCKYIGRTVRNLSTHVGEYILYGWGRKALASPRVSKLSTYTRKSTELIPARYSKWSSEPEAHKRLRLVKLSLLTGLPIFVCKSN